MRKDDCGMSRHPTHGVEASSSRAALPTPDGTAARPEQEREHASATPAHFSEAQAEQALWQEFRNHGVSLNNTLNEALRIHVGPEWRAFQVRIFSVEFRSFFPPLFLSSLPHLRFLSLSFPLALFAGDRSWRTELGRGTTASTN
jgi:hypothetical protein